MSSILDALNELKAGLNEGLNEIFKDYWELDILPNNDIEFTFGDLKKELDSHSLNLINQREYNDINLYLIQGKKEDLDKVVDDLKQLGVRVSSETVNKEADLNRWDLIESCKVENDFYESEDIIKDENLNESTNIDEEDEKNILIKIEVIADTDIKEGLPSGNINDNYDEQTLEDWYDFAATVEGIINKDFIVKNISLSKNITSLSEYIDFYRKLPDGTQQDGMIDLRLSDHPSSSIIRTIRKRKASRLDPNYKLISVIVNDKQFNNYQDALTYIKNLLKTL